MDDMKRAMYIAARNAIQKGQAKFICLALKDELRAQGLNLYNTYADPEGYEAMEQLMEELFPEFFHQFDRKFWLESAYGEEFAIFSNYKHAAWFGNEDKERRLRILDFIIDNR